MVMVIFTFLLNIFTNFKKYIIYILAICLLILFTYTYFLYFNYQEVKVDNDRLTNNVRILSSTKVDTIRSANNELISKTGILYQTIKETKENSGYYTKSKVKTLIKDLKIDDENGFSNNLSNIKSIAEEKIEVDYIDTTILKLNKDNNIKSGLDSGRWFINRYQILGNCDTLISNISYRDSAVLLVYKYKIGNWKLINLIIKRKTAYKSAIKLTCPDSKIFINQTEFEKN